MEQKRKKEKMHRFEQQCGNFLGRGWVVGGGTYKGNTWWWKEN